MAWAKKGLLYQPNPNLPWSKSHASLPTADHLGDGLYRIYYSSRDQHNISRVGFFELDINHPEQILQTSDQPVLSTGELGTFDESGVWASWIVPYKNTKYLYYIGWNRGETVPFRNSLGLAISHDGGLSFQKISAGPILDRSIHDPCFVASCCALVEDDLWQMWYLSAVRWERYNNELRHFYHIKYAESSDGINWRRSGIICIDFESTDEYAISRPCVIKEDNLYKMWYSYRGKYYRIGYAESKDGKTWIRKDDQVNLDRSKTGWDSEMIEYPFVLTHQKKHYMLYNGNGYGKTGIGYAILES